jgi:hypothetical protein
MSLDIIKLHGEIVKLFGGVYFECIAVVHFVELMGLGMPRLAPSDRFLSQGIQVALETGSRIKLRNLCNRDNSPAVNNFRYSL